MRFIKTLMWAVLLTLCATSCKKWDDVAKVDNPALTETLLQEISKRQSLSTFYQYLQKTGLDKELASSKSYTVWAPVNEALATLDPAVVADSARLRLVIQNHISNQAYFIRDAQSSVRIKMLNGKRVTFSTTQFDLATITESDKYMSNGVLHVINNVAPYLPNAYQLANDTKGTYAQSNFLISLNYNGFDPNTAIIDSISTVTGLPVYRPGTGVVPRNLYNDRVYNLQNEDSLYTYFLLENTAYNQEVNNLKPYFVTGTADSTQQLAAYQMTRDLTVSGMYSINQLPDSLTSKFNVRFRVDKSKIVQTIRLSNGVAYVMSSLNFTAKSKIPTVVIQGESPRGFFRPTGEAVDVRGTTFYRLRQHPVTREHFNDIYLYNHGIALLNIQYQAPALPSTKYKVYWVAVNDTIRVSTDRINPAVFSQRLAMGTRTATNFAATSVPLNTHDEIYLGDYTHQAYGTLDMFLTAANTTAAATNRLTLDYIKLVPDIQ